MTADLDGVSVFIAMPTHRDLPPKTVLSLLETQTTSHKLGIESQVLFATGFIPEARSICVHHFLKSGANKLFWIDSDMVWEPKSFLRMLFLSTKIKAVCASYPRKKEPLEFLLEVAGSIVVNEHDCIPCETGGLGFSVIDREIIQKLVEKAPRYKLPIEGRDVLVSQLFRFGTTKDNRLMGEDVIFFRDIRELGYEIWCDPHIKLGHVGTKIYQGSLYENIMSKAHEHAKRSSA